MECKNVEEGIELHNITISWEGETFDITLLVTPVGLAPDDLVKLVGVRFVVSFVVMD